MAFQSLLLPVCYVLFVSRRTLDTTEITERIKSFRANGIALMLMEFLFPLHKGYDDFAIVFSNENGVGKSRKWKWGKKTKIDKIEICKVRYGH